MRSAEKWINTLQCKVQLVEFPEGWVNRKGVAKAGVGKEELNSGGSDESGCKSRRGETLVFSGYRGGGSADSSTEINASMLIKPMDMDRTTTKFNGNPPEIFSS